MSTLNNMVAADLEPEGLTPEGVDLAAQLLRRYNRDARTWDIDKDSSFWRSCQLLASHPPRLEDADGAPLIAVVDGGFDTSIPALREHVVVGQADADADVAHGTIVALLILEVVPHARLLLYPVMRQRKLDAAAVAAAIVDAAQRQAKVINLSMGIKRPLATWFDREGFEAALVEDANGRRFAMLKALADTPFRKWLRVPRTPVGDAVASLSGTVTQVVAAVGNAKDTLAIPAVLDNVIGAGFIAERRELSRGMESAEAEGPSYAQAAFTDIAVVQPPGVLGSSFATPLIAGFTAGACSGRELADFREMVRLGGIASELWKLTHVDATTWDAARHGVVDDLFLRAVRSSPHQHHLSAPQQIQPCPACSFFAAQTYINYGLFKLNWGDLAGAEHVLRTVRAFSPLDANAAANLAVTYGAIAEKSNANPARMREMLASAISHMRAAIRLRPDHVDYQVALANLEAGLASSLSNS